MPDPKRPPKVARWLHLIAFLLQHRFAVTREQIFARVPDYGGDEESARRKFERDKEELRRLGVAIETVPLEGGGDEAALGYRLRPAGTYLPYFELTDQPAEPGPYPGLPRIALSADELGVLDRATRRLAERDELPLAAAAAAARRKLAFDLPLEPDAVEQILAEPLPEESRRALSVLQEATAARTAVGCVYYSASRDETAERVIEPYGLLFEWGHWYCVARARDRGAIRMFRVDRMREARVLEGPGSGFQVPDGFDLQAWSGRAPWEMGEGAPTRVTARFAFPESRWVRHHQAARLVGEEEDGAADYEFEVREPQPFLRWVLSFRRRATILGPEPMRQELDTLRGEVAALYAEPDE